MLSMNRRGQALVAFVLFLPLIALFVGYFVNVVEEMVVKNKIDGIVYDNLKISLDKDIRDENKIINSIKENDQNLNAVVTILDDDITIEVNVQRKNIFNVFNKEKYDIQVKYCANYLDKKIKNNNCG